MRTDPPWVVTCVWPWMDADISIILWLSISLYADVITNIYIKWTTPYHYTMSLTMKKLYKIFKVQ